MFVSAPSVVYRKVCHDAGQEVLDVGLFERRALVSVLHGSPPVLLLRLLDAVHIDPVQSPVVHIGLAGAGPKIAF